MKPLDSQAYLEKHGFAAGEIVVAATGEEFAIEGRGTRDGHLAVWTGSGSRTELPIAKLKAWQEEHGSVRPGEVLTAETYSKFFRRRLSHRFELPFWHDVPDAGHFPGRLVTRFLCDGVILAVGHRYYDLTSQRVGVLMGPMYQEKHAPDTARQVALADGRNATEHFRAFASDLRPVLPPRLT